MRGFARAQLTVTLVNPFYANAHNGLLTFLYREGEVTNGWLQVFQENVDWLKQDFWASVELRISDENTQWLSVETENYQRRLANRLPRLDMQSLKDRVSAELLQAYDGNVSGQNLSATGLYFDGTLYTQPMSTRYGRFPYPQSMRHGVFSVSKSPCCFRCAFSSEFAISGQGKRCPDHRLRRRIASGAGKV